jgi:hypothetical protein
MVSDDSGWRTRPCCIPQSKLLIHAAIIPGKTLLNRNGYERGIGLCLRRHEEGEHIEWCQEGEDHSLLEG